LGRFACRVTSKIAGIGNAERNWGDVKHLKTGSRSHLSSDMISKAATIYGAACAEKASKSFHKEEIFTMWDDIDMDNLGLDKFGLDSTKFRIDPDEIRIVRCFLEPWEEDCITKQDIVNEAKLIKKYGGLSFEDGGIYTIDKTKCNWQKKKGSRRYNLLCCKPDYNPNDPDEDDYDNFLINDDLHGLIFTYYTKNPDPKIRLEYRAEHVNPRKKEWINWVPDKDGGFANQKKKSVPRKGQSPTGARPPAPGRPPVAKPPASGSNKRKATGGSKGSNTRRKHP
jgi:hypothetical protein